MTRLPWDINNVPPVALSANYTKNDLLFFVWSEERVGSVYPTENWHVNTQATYPTTTRPTGDSPPLTCARHPAAPTHSDGGGNPLFAQKVWL